MKLEHYFTSLAQELGSLKGRVRHLIADAHWLTDGEWKESVVRQVLRRNLPATVEVGRGFVVTGNRASRQLDVLIRDASKPVVFRDGDLAFITPDAVLGVIEVKSRMTAGIFEDSLRKLASDIEMVRLHPNTRAFAALFSFEAANTSGQRLLTILARVLSNSNQRLDFASIGESIFLKYWELDPRREDRRMYESWHSYSLPNHAQGYFIHNAIDAISPESVFSNNEVWFPVGGKEPYRDGYIRAAWAQHKGGTATGQGQ